MTIWANCIVCNEENFIWFAVMSVIDFVDKVLIWDTGSTDRTVEIIRKIREIKGDKVDFKEVGEVDKNEFTKMRQKMLEESKCDWVLILDGDEIWWEDSIKRVVKEIDLRGNQVEGIVVPMIVPVGDIYHFQEESAGRYQLSGRKGHLTLRAISKKIPGLHAELPYGKEGFLDKDGRLVQERAEIIFLEASYLHVTHLKRSPQKREYEKFKYELGNKAKECFRFPEVLYKRYPEFINSPWVKISGAKLIKAKILTPLRKIKRRII